MIENINSVPPAGYPTFSELPKPGDQKLTLPFTEKAWKMLGPTLVHNLSLQVNTDEIIARKASQEMKKSIEGEG